MKSHYIHLMVLSVLTSCISCSKSDTGTDTPESEQYVLLTENYGDGVNALLLGEYVAFYGYDDVSDISDMADDEFVITISKVTSGGRVDSDRAVAIVTDSTLFPRRMASNDFNLFLTERADDGYMNCCYYDKEQSGWQDIGITHGIIIDDNLRSIAVSDFSAHKQPHAECVLEVLSKMKELQYALYGIVDLSDVWPDIETAAIKSESFSLEGAETAIETGILYLIRNVDVLTEPIVGQARPVIEEIVQKDDDSVQISYTVSGIENSAENRDVSCSLMIYSEDADPVSAREIKFRNGTNTVTVADLTAGEYTVDFELRIKAMPIIRYRTVDDSDFSVFDASVSGITFDSNPVYNNGTVTFKYNIKISSSDACLEKYNEFGYFLSHNDTTEYRPLDADLWNDGITEVNDKINIDEDDFAVIDYASCIAKTPEINVGLYVRKQKDALPSEFNVKSIGKLEYSTSPSLLFLDAKVTGTEYLGDEGKYSLFKTDYKFSYSADGAFWISKIVYKTDTEGWDISWEADSYKDGDYYYNAYLKYKKIATEEMDRIDYLEAELKNGETLKSTNCLHFTGPNSSPEVEIVEGK